MITALQTAVPGIGADVLPLLQSAQPPIETVLAAVLNELAAAPNDVDLVLDDYHLVDGPDLRDGMTFLLEHLPPHVHLVISSRADPLLPLARLRARGELVEVRAADLRFTPDEVAAYLNDVIGLDLAAGRHRRVGGPDRRLDRRAPARRALHAGTDGHRRLHRRLRRATTGTSSTTSSRRCWQRQTEQVRTFLLRTCLLDRLNGPLCDAVTGEPGGKATLEALDRANLFLVPLDDSRHWYRYHHLFADMLQAHLSDERPDEVTDLHRRASRWYDHNGQPSPAVRHALAAGDIERAADLVELAIPALQRNRQEATIRGWLDAIPDEVVRMRPVLAVGLVGALMAGNEFEGIEERLRDAERWLEPATRDREELHAPFGGNGRRRRAGALAPPRGDRDVLGRAGVGAEVTSPATLRHAQLAIDRAADEDHVTRAGGLGHLRAGVLGRAEISRPRIARTPPASRGCGGPGTSPTSWDVRSRWPTSASPRVAWATRCARSSGPCSSPPRNPGPVLRGTADMYVGMSQIACERGDLHAATQHLLRSQELGEHTGLPQNPYRWRVAMARVREAQGDLAGALTLLDDAQRVYLGDFSPNVRPVPALRARVLAAQGRWGEALDWAREQGLSADDNLTYVREFEHITLARVLLARYAIRR